jgi:hypothetical protein
MNAQLQSQTKTATSFTPVKTGLLQRACACGQHSGNGGEGQSCRKKREGILQRAAVNAPPVANAPPIVHEVLRSPGQPLDAVTRTFVEPKFRHELSRVSIDNVLWN